MRAEPNKESPPNPDCSMIIMPSAAKVLPVNSLGKESNGPTSLAIAPQGVVTPVEVQGFFKRSSGPARRSAQHRRGCTRRGPSRRGRRPDALIWALWPSRLSSSWPVTGSQRRIVRLLPAAARISPSGLKARHRSSSSSVAMVWTRDAVARSQTVIRPFSSAAARLRPSGRTARP